MIVRVAPRQHCGLPSGCIWLVHFGAMAVCWLASLLSCQSARPESGFDESGGRKKEWKENEAGGQFFQSDKLRATKAARHHQHQTGLLLTSGRHKEAAQETLSVSPL